MAIEHVNRKGEKYYLQSTIDKAGNARYSLTRKLKGTPADQVPEGYEIYEMPEGGQVVLRKFIPSQIWSSEKDLLAGAIRRLAKIERFIIDTEPDHLVVYLADEREADTIVEIMSERSELGFMGQFAARAMKERYLERAQYTKMMRFILTDTTKRNFCCERWCFRGSIDNWFPLMRSSGPLAVIAEKYVVHLGKESFYDLM